MRINIRIFALFLAVAVFAGAGCQKKKKPENDTGYHVLCVNTQGTALLEQPFVGSAGTTEETIDSMLKELKSQEDLDVQPAIPANVEIESYTCKNGKLDLHFSSQYRQMKPVQEVLCRAAVVRTLTQISGVNQVMFYIGEYPLTNRDGISYGYMQASDFVQNTGSSINSYEVTSFVIYFAEKSGEKLMKDEVSIRSSSNQMRESVAIENLIKGPKCEGAIATIPQGTELLSSSIRDGICYLNFNEGLNSSIPGVTPEVVIYSIVNTVVECGNAGLVQIAINGESNITFQESVKLGEPLSRNLDIVEGK